MNTIGSVGCVCQYNYRLLLFIQQATSKWCQYMETTLSYAWLFCDTSENIAYIPDIISNNNIDNETQVQMNFLYRWLNFHDPSITYTEQRTTIIGSRSHNAIMFVFLVCIALVFGIS